jgi:hypothetical protein
MPRKKEWTLEELRKLPRTRGEAIALNTRYYFNDNLCKEHHVAPRRFDGKCLDCLRIRDRKRQRRYSAERRKISKWEDGRVSKSIDLIALIKSGLPSSKKEAKKLGSKYYYTGKPCKNNHLSPRRRSTGNCMQCQRGHQQKHGEERKIRYRHKIDHERIKAGVPLKTPQGKDVASYRHGRSRSLEQLLYLTARGRARNKGIKFSISVQDIQIPSHCPILGIKLSNTWGGVDMNSQARAAQPTLDRIDPRKGYVPGNVIVTSYRANMIKGDGMPEEHRAIAKYIEKELDA